MSSIAVAGTTVEVSHLDKVFYPSCAFTKGDVLRYYQEIAPLMLPHLAGRPVSVIRYPDGIAGLRFFEKRSPAKRPAWVKVAPVTSAHFGTIDYCVIDNPQSLVWMANRAALEFHTYLFRASREDRPTMMVFDLDPGPPATVLDCLEVAVTIRDLLAGMGLQAFAKTSGGKGLHLGIPLRGAGFAATKAFAHGVADALARNQPKRVTSAMAKDQRRGRVFIDWSQNDHGKTTACAYTLRAQPFPTVSTPVSWEEIEQARKRGKAERLRFTADQVVERVRKLGDLFAPTLSLRQSLPKLKDAAGG